MALALIPEAFVRLYPIRERLRVEKRKDRAVIFELSAAAEQQPGMTVGHTQKGILMNIRVALVSSFSLLASLGVAAQAQNAPTR